MSFSPIYRMGRVEAGTSFSIRMGQVEAGASFNPRMGRL